MSKFFCILCFAFIISHQSVIEYKSNTQDNSDDAYRFLLLLDDGIYVLEPNHEAVTLNKITSHSLESVIIAYADVTSDGNFMLLIRAKSEFTFDLALFTPQGEFIRYLTQLETPLSVWDDLDITYDGTYIVNYTQMLNAIAIIKTDSSQPVTQFTELFYGARPSISYNGQYVVYDQGLGVGLYSIMLVDIGENHIYDPDSEIKITTGLQEPCTYPDFHPNEFKVVYTCTSDFGLTSPSIFITDILTGDTFNVLSPARNQFGNCVRWAPDGQHLTWISTNAQAVYVYSLQTNQIHEITIPQELLSNRTIFNNCVVWLGS